MNDKATVRQRTTSKQIEDRTFNLMSQLEVLAIIEQQSHEQSYVKWLDQALCASPALQGWGQAKHLR